MTLADVLLIMPRCPDEWAAELLQAMPMWDITTPLREAAFLAQFAVETNEFTQLEENLNYSVGTLMHVWPARFPTEESALPYAHKPETLANFVYANRMGNGPPESGDGWMYRGRGPQLTGRANYRAADQALGLPLEAEPERLMRPSVACEVACWLFYSRGCNDLTDAQDFVGITRKINGGLIGQDQRVAYYTKAKEVLGL